MGLTQVLGICIGKKAFWSCLVVAFAVVLLLSTQSWRAGACMAVILMISLFSLFEEYQEGQTEP